MLLGISDGILVEEASTSEDCVDADVNVVGGPLGDEGGDDDVGDASSI